MRQPMILVLCVLWAGVSCNALLNLEDFSFDAAADTDTDIDSDTDTDTDTNTDTDTIPDTNTDTDTIPDTDTDTDTVPDTDTDTDTVPDTDTDTDTVPDTDTDTDTIPDTDTDTGVLSPCVGMTCIEPPPLSCALDGSDGVQTYAPFGYCANGDCVYASYVEECGAGGCMGGVCTDDPCMGITCASSPDAICEGGRLRIYNATGYCDASFGGAQCQYSSVSVDCAGGCVEGMCSGDPCLGKVCNRSPARYCDGDELVVFDVEGRCDGGSCVYASQRVACGSGCDVGACVGESVCAHVECRTSPAARCVDADTLRSYQGIGTCSAGMCRYGATDTVCANGCHQGQCVNEPCVGVTCVSPPSRYCADADTLVFYGGISACADGGCQYQMESIVCAGGCVTGQCVGSPCDGVICTAPPPDYCDGVELRGYASPGVCGADGRCTYATTGQTCPYTCDPGTMQCTGGCDMEPECWGAMSCYACALEDTCFSEKVACESSLDCAELSECMDNCAMLSGNEYNNCYISCRVSNSNGWQFYNSLQSCIYCDACPNTCHMYLNVVSPLFDLSCASFVDDDSDGWSPPFDCNDNDPTIYPGAYDIPGDGIDQNCSGYDAEWPTDTDTDTAPDLVSSMIDCDGGKLDLDTNLCWQNSPSGEMNWYQASGVHHATLNPGGIDHCGTLFHGGHSDWRLPNIEELISLSRGCQNGTATGDLSPSLCEMTPTGCVTTDSCSNRTSCNACSLNSGPGAASCYWDPALTGTCSWYWSSSSYGHDPSSGWVVDFLYGYSLNNAKTMTRHARCVRGGP